MRKNRKLTEQQVQEIMCLEKLRSHYEGLAKTYKRENIANKYGVSYSVITAIVSGISYADIKEKECEGIEI